MTTLSTPEELNALPNGYIVEDSQHCVWQKLNILEGQEELQGAAVLWQRFGSKTVHTTDEVAHWAPFEVVADRPFLTPRTLRNAIVRGLRGDDA